ncbi:S8 family serine peptidase, partial [bacterium]|nr:S8 family serine peptidase [bacterium]
PGETGGGKENNGVDDDENGYFDDWRGWDYTGADNDPSYDPTTFKFGHGTDVASVAAGVANNQVAGVGIAHGCRVMHLRANTNYDINDAMRYAADMGARVINISQGSYTYSDTERSGIAYAQSSGVLVCCAAGNDATDNDAAPLYPASYDLPNILAVAASDKDDGLWLDAPGAGSNFGATSVDLAAPGSEITSAAPGRTVLFESDLAPQTLFSDDFDDNNFAPDWTLGSDPGDENAWANAGAVAISWKYSDPFDPNSRTWIESRAFDTSGRAGLALSYYYDVTGEANDDYLSVEVWDGGAWREVARHASGVSGESEWGVHNVGIASHRGPGTRIRFVWHADGDDNDYYGALVDDVRVVALPSAWTTGKSSGVDGWMAVDYGPDFQGAGSYGDGQYPYSANAHTWLESTVSFDASGAQDIAVYYTYAVDAEFAGTAHDYLVVQVWDGLGWREVSELHSGADPGLPPRIAVADASAFANGAMKVRFLWHSDGDNNDFGGAEVFHVEVSKAGGTNYGTLHTRDVGSFGSGTSDASPLVAGVAALVWSEFPSLTWGEVRDRILDNVDKKPAFAGKCVTGGRLNAYRALAQHTVRFETAASTAGEGVSPAQVWVELAPASPEAVTVSYGVTGGTAAGAGQDYALLVPGTVTFAPGETRQPIDVVIVDDPDTEGDETVVIGIGNPAGAALGSPSSHELTIRDNEGGPVLYFDLAVSTVDEGAGAALLTVSLSQPVAEEVRVDYAVTGGTATRGDDDDYVLADGTLVFPVGGAPSQDIEVTVRDDPFDESDETVAVTLSNVQGQAALAAPTVHTLMIEDNDPLPLVSFDLATSGDTEATTVVALGVTLSAPSGRQVIVGYVVTDGTAVQGADYFLTPGRLVFAAGETTGTVALTIVADGVPEGDETIDVSLTPVAGAALGAPATHVYTIVGEDLPGAPSGLTHTAQTLDSITWGWTDNADDEDSFRGYGPGDAQVWSVGADSTSHVEGGLDTNTQYVRTVRSVEDGVESPPSTPHAAYTAIEGPTGVWFGAIGPGSAQVGWVGLLSNLAAGNSGAMLRNVTAGADSGWLQSAGGSWTSAPLIPNKEYIFDAQARNGDGDLTARSPGSTVWTLPTAPSVGADRTVGLQYPAGTPFTFTNLAAWGEGGVSEYRIAWDTQPTHAFVGGEASWSSGPLTRTGAVPGAWYLHVQSRNAEGAPNLIRVDLGPFHVVAPQVDHFDWDPVASPRGLDVPFGVRVVAKDSNGAVVSNFGGTVGLAGWSGAAPATLWRDDFEDGVLDGWSGAGDGSTRTLTDATAGQGARSVTIAGGAIGHQSGLWATLPGITPDRMDFHVRSSSAAASDGYVVVGEGGVADTAAILFAMASNGQMTVVSSNTSYGHPYVVDRWYKVSFVFDWGAKTFDYYVDDALVQADVSFRGAAVTQLTRLDLYNFHDSQAWWDDIRFGRAGSGTAVSISPTVTGPFLGGVWTGNVTVHETGSDIWLRADDGAGHVGASNVFDVEDLPPAPAPPVALAIDTVALFGNVLNVTGPACRSLGIVGLDGGANPASTEYAIQIGTDPGAGWLRFVDAGGRTDVYADGAAPEWHSAADWAGLRVRGLTPGASHVFWSTARNGAGAESAHVDVGAYSTNAAGDVNDSGGIRPVRGSDHALVRQALTDGATLGVDQAWACDVNDDGAVTDADRAEVLTALTHPQ